MELRKPESGELPAGPEKDSQKQPVNPTMTVFVLKHHSSDQEAYSDEESAVQMSD